MSLEDIRVIKINLEIISNIKKGDKLQYHDGRFYTDEWNYFQPLIRWYNNDTRIKTVTELYTLIENVFKIIDRKSILNNYYEPILKEMKLTDNNDRELMEIIDGLNKCIIGINNLKETYKNDIRISELLNILIEKIEIRIKKNNEKKF